jgi:transposase
MPAAKPPEFRRRAVELARRREKPIAEIAHDLGIAESCLRRWLKQDDIDTGRTEGVTTDERAELVRLRRELQVAQMEIEILKRARADSSGRRNTSIGRCVHGTAEGLGCGGSGGSERPLTVRSRMTAAWLS